MELQGKIIKRGITRSGMTKSNTEWKSFKFVLETQEQYPSRAVFEVFNPKNFDIMDKVAQEGAVVTVSFDFDASEYKGQWYNRLKVWRIMKEGAEAQPEPNQPSKAAVTDFAPPAKTAGDNKPVQDEGDRLGSSADNSDLPF